MLHAGSDLIRDGDILPSFSWKAPHATEWRLGLPTGTHRHERAMGHRRSVEYVAGVAGTIHHDLACHFTHSDWLPEAGLANPGVVVAGRIPNNA
jgi:hypothetical protein